MTDERAFYPIYDRHLREAVAPAHSALRDILREWRDAAYWHNADGDARFAAPMPVQRAFCRIKTPQSAAAKILAKPAQFPAGLAEESLWQMGDLLGGRVVVYFLAGLTILDHAIRRHPRLEICPDDPPTAYMEDALAARLGLSDIVRPPKESGYYSVHYTLRLRGGARPFDFELQIRTLAADIWGEIEHILAYKPGASTDFVVRRQFQVLGRMMLAVDEQFNLLNEEIRHRQDDAKPADDDELTAENLPAVLREIRIGCLQEEIGEILQLLAARQIGAAGQLRGLADDKTVARIRAAYRKRDGRNPSNAEVVDNLIRQENRRNF